MTQYPANRLIFIDESGSNLSSSRLYARSFGGHRIRMPKPYVRGHHYSLISAISLDGVQTSLYGTWATDATIFETFIEKCLLPTLKAGDIVIMDNVKFHKTSRVQQCIQSVNATLKFLPPYSPDFSPIELMWSKIKSIIKQYEPRTDQQFKKIIKIAFKAVTLSDLAGWFKHCGYMPSTVF